jgi:hypothetical protein
MQPVQAQYAVLPSAHAGYWRGAFDWPEIGGAGPQMPSLNIPGLSSTATPGMAGNWHPTVLWMLGFVVAELFAFHFLSKHLNII